MLSSQLLCADHQQEQPRPLTFYVVVEMTGATRHLLAAQVDLGGKGRVVPACVMAKKGQSTGLANESTADGGSPVPASSTQPALRPLSPTLGHNGV